MAINTNPGSYMRGKIIKGRGVAKTMGYPTLNLDNPEVMSGHAEGVYLAEVKIHNLTYNGLLYFGPRLVMGETQNILEIFVMGFAGQIYGEHITFVLREFIREKKEFKNLEELKRQIEKDFEHGLKIIAKTPKAKI